MKVEIRPGQLHGVIEAPPSKSYAHRMLICASLAQGKSTLDGISSSEDMLATMDCIKALGAEVSFRGTKAQIKGIGSGSRLPVFPCRESGSTLRFMIPISLAVCGGGVFTGTQRLMERGIGVYEELFKNSGILLEKDAGSITLKGTLKPGTFRIRGDISSQFITGMLYALSLLEEDSTIEVLPPVESRPYIDITVAVMKEFGVDVKEEIENLFYIKGGQSYHPGDRKIEGDWSNAAFLYALQSVGHPLTIEGLNDNSIQGDKACVGFLKQLKGEVQKTDGKELRIDLSGTPDLGPVLFACAGALRGGVFSGTKRLRIKESDRAEAMAEELKKFGITCLVGENDVVVLQGPLQKPRVQLSGHNDHRIVMALSVLASLTGGTIDGAEAVRKSWPDYFSEMKRLGMDLEERNKEDDHEY